jgi:hypothetical protein
MDNRNLLPITVIMLIMVMAFPIISSGLFENDVVIQPGGGSGEKGDKGDPGDCTGLCINGTNGTAAIVMVNATFTGLPGTPASVVDLNATPENATLDFTVPEGIKGDKGDPGDPGAPGADGDDGYTPVKGIDYFDGINGTNGTNGINGVTGGYTILYNFSTSTSAPPADKTVRYNSGTPASVSSIYVEETERGGSDVAAFLASLTIGTKIRLFKESDVVLFHLYNITSITDSGDYYTLGVDTFSGNPSNFANTDGIGLGFAPRGAVGATGAPGGGGGDTSQFLFLNGTRAMTGNFSMASNYIVNMILPSVGTDGANKLYVDNVNNSQTLNTSYAISAANTTMNLNTSLAIVAANNSMKAYADALNESQRLNTSYFHASKVAGKVPTAELGSGAASASTYLRGDQTWATPAVGGGTVYNYYTIPFQALTNSPADNVVNYIGGRPIAPSTTANTNKMVIPTSGIVERVEIYDYSGTAGTAETYGYYIMHNGATEYWINNLTVATSERIFSNSTIRFNVAAGDYVEIKRKHPAWATNPLTNIVGGYVLINQTATSALGGYTLPVMALTSSPTDGQTVYFGNRPIAPSTTAGTNKIFVPKTGTISRVEVYCYSGTAGTAESWNMNVGVNGSYTFVAQVSNALNERIFRNASLSVPVTAGQYIEMQGVQPTWATNPATTIYGGYVYVT